MKILHPKVEEIRFKLYNYANPDFLASKGTTPSKECTEKANAFIPKFVEALENFFSASTLEIAQKEQEAVKSKINAEITATNSTAAADYANFLKNVLMTQVDEAMAVHLKALSSPLPMIL